LNLVITLDQKTYTVPMTRAINIRASVTKVQGPEKASGQFDPPGFHLEAPKGVPGPLTFVITQILGWTYDQWDDPLHPNTYDLVGKAKDKSGNWHDCKVVSPYITVSRA